MYKPEENFFSLLMNNQNIDNVIDKKFNHDLKIYGMEISLRNVYKEGNTRFTAFWANKPIQTLSLNVLPANNIKFDVCNPTYDLTTNYLLKNGTTNEEYFTFDICITDLYLNPKYYESSYVDDLIKVEYPDNIIPDKEIKYSSNKEKTIYTIQVPTVSKGVYKIYNQNFFNDNIKYFIIIGGKPDIKKSYGEIKDYLENRITKADKVINLNIYLRDSSGGKISNEEMVNLKCSFDKSIIINSFQNVKTELPLGEYVIVNDIPTLSFTPKNPGEYTFVPKMSCGSDSEAFEIYCSSCNFYVSTSTVDNIKFKLYSDFYETYFFSQEINENNSLIISLDEDQNLKLTTILILDTSGVPIFVNNLTKNIADALNSFTANISCGDGQTISLNTKINPSGGIDLFIENKTGRTNVFSPLEKYYLVFSLNNANFKISETKILLKFSYRDDFLNNVSNLNIAEAEENFFAEWKAGNFQLNAGENLMLFRVIAKNTQNQISYGNTLDCNSISIEASIQKDVKFETIDVSPSCQKNGIFLTVSGNFKTSGIYNLKLNYNKSSKRTLYEISNFRVFPRKDVFDLKFDTKNPLIKSIDDSNNIILVDQRVGDIFSFDFYMYDEYGNLINQNYLQIMDQMKIINTGEGDVLQLVDGRILITGNENLAGNYSVTLTLTNNKIYKVTWKRFSNSIDPYFSGSDIEVKGDRQKYLIVYFYVYDKYNQNLNKETLMNASIQQDILKNLYIYATSQYQEIFDFKFSSIETLNQLNYMKFLSTQQITRFGEYKLFTYYNDIPVICQICHANYKNDIQISSDNILVDLYSIGYKSSDKFLNKDKYLLFTSIKNLPIFAAFKDNFGNEIENYNKKIDLGLFSEKDDTEIARFCYKKMEHEKRQYLEICKEYLAEIQKLETGNYYIAASKMIGPKFLFTLQKEYEKNSSNPSERLSSIGSEENLVIASIDSPARIIVDFRNDNNQRYENIDLTKITVIGSYTDKTLNMDSNDMKIFHGPAKGLVTIVLFNDKVITKDMNHSIAINYNSLPVIKDIKIIFESGRMAKIELGNEETLFTSAHRYNIFNLLDVNNNPVKNLNLNIDNFIDKLVTIKDLTINAYYLPNIDYNFATGKISLKLDKKITNELEITSPYISTPIKIHNNIPNLDIKKSFVYLENFNQGKINEQINMKIQLLDDENNYLSASSEIINKYADKFSIMILRSQKEDLEHIETIKFNKELTNDKNGIVLSKIANSSGEFLFIPFYDNFPIRCSYCKKVISSGNFYQMNLTSIKIRSGNDWHDIQKDNSYLLYKKYFPVFKIILNDESNSPIISSMPDLSILLTNEKEDFSITMTLHFKNSDGVYAYLNAEGRKKFLSIEVNSKIKLKINKTNDSSSYITFNNFYILNSEITFPKPVQCLNDSSVNLFEPENNYIIRAGSEALIEFELTGCENDENSFNDNIDDFTITICSEDKIKCESVTKKKDWFFRIIPSDTYGKYLLLIGSNAVGKNQSVFIKYKNSPISSPINLSVISLNRIANIEFENQNTEIKNNYYFLKVKAFDYYNNVITRDFTNTYLRDIFFDIVDSSNRKVLYDFTYITSTEQFYIKLFNNKEKNFKISLPDSQDIKIVNFKDYTDSLKNSVLTLDKFIYKENSLETRSFIFRVDYKNYKFETTKVDNDKTLPNLIFKFYSLDLNINESFVISSNIVTYNSDGTITATFESNLRMLQYSVIVPLAYNNDELVCLNCFINNQSNNYVYLSNLKNDLKSNYMISFEKVLLHRGGNDILFLWYEGNSKEVTLFDEKDSKNIKIFTYSRKLYNGLQQTLIGMNFSQLNENLLNNPNYILSISNGNSDVKKLKIINIQDETPSKNIFDVKNIVISGLKANPLIAGQSQYFFIELRDSNYKLTNYDANITFDNVIKYNVIKSSVEGIYLIEYLVEVIPKVKNFSIKVDNQVVNYPIKLNVIPDYPVNMDTTSLHSREILGEELVKYGLNVYDKFGNLVCDGRVNFEIINENNMNDFYINYDNLNDQCNVEFHFYGKSTLISPLLNDIQLKLENMRDIHISYTESYILLDSNNVKSNDTIKLSAGIYYESGGKSLSSNLNINIKYVLYFILENNQKFLVSEFYTSALETKFDAKNLGRYGNYMIKTIVDGVEFLSYAYFKLNKSGSKDLSDILLKLKKKNLWTNIDYIYDKTNSLEEKDNPYYYPFTYKLSLLNSERSKLVFSKDVKVEAAIIPDPKLNFGVDKIIALEGITNSQSTYLITHQKTLSKLILDLPKGKYYIKIVVTNSSNSITRYVPFSIKKGSYQNNDFDYHLPITKLSNTFEIIGLDGINTIYTNLGSYSTTNICLKFNNKILNEYIDPSLLTINNINNNQCTFYNGIHFRGCTQISIMCSTINNGLDNLKAGIVYNGIKSLNDLTILIDPSLPPKSFNVLSKFPETSEQMKNIQANFKVLDEANKEFKYLNSENFDLFDNDRKLEKNYWKFLSNNGASIQLTLPYPPQQHNIKVFFKHTSGIYIRVNELNSSVNLTQGKINPLKTILGVPIYYKSGDTLAIPILLRDDYSNCYEDSINLSLLKLKLIKDSNTFENFDFAQAKYNTPLCSNYILAKANNMNFTQMGPYKVEFYYDNVLYPLSNNKLYISPNIISEKSSTITVRNKEIIDSVDVLPGENFEVLIKGTDINGNPVPYGEIIEKLKVNIGDLAIEKKDYKSILYSDENYMIISLTIYKPGIYALDISIDNIKLNSQKGLKIINVKKGKCDKAYPKIEVKNQKVQVGEYAEIKIVCRDAFNNTVDSINQKDFSINIKGKNLLNTIDDIVPYDTKITQDTLTAFFLVIYTGDYEVSVYLKGAQYGDFKLITGIKNKCPDNTPIRCANRECVKSAAECKDLITEFCPDPEKPFYCNIGDQKACVSKLEECKCKSDQVECKGMCIPKSIKNFCVDSPLRDCSDFPNTNVCFDGSCKIGTNCGNDLACPLGYKICGANCISKNLNCIFEVEKCKATEVLCWDYTCAPSYDNCPTRKICDDKKSKVCPDGTCVSNAEFCYQPPICTSPFEYLCPDFSCRKSKNDCAKKLVCPPGLSLCEDNKCLEDCSKRNKVCKDIQILCKSGDCVEYPQLCPSEISCPQNKIKCENSACVNSIEECKFRKGHSKITCPDKTPILCPDLSCVDVMTKCLTTLQNNNCPANNPYRCENNECRKNFKECPTIITCPKDFPVLCPDNSCQKASYHCKTNEFDIDMKSKKILCADGSFVSSLSQCPTNLTCNENMIKCWNSSCAFSIDKCPVPKYINCPNDFPIRCFDGSCRQTKEDCPSITLCPINKPIKCLDGSCRESLTLCPKVTECPIKYYPCPNGTCAFEGKCSPLITCPSFSPYLCPNKKCVRDYKECEITRECKGFLCPDGECVDNRMDCISINPCDTKYPVRCDNQSCVAKIEDCYSVANKCPVGYVECKSGGCEINEDLCTENKCPDHKPFKCKDGRCVLNPNYCDLDNGCPYSYPIKCKYGSCKKTKEECNKIESNEKMRLDDEYKKIVEKRQAEDDRKEKEDNESKKREDEERKKYYDTLNEEDRKKAIEQDEIRRKKEEKQKIKEKEDLEKIRKEEDAKIELENKVCPDGSKPIGNECPLENGCFKDKSIKCSNGMCVKDKSECYDIKCPLSRPIKCLNGMCVGFISECNLINNNNDDYEACKKVGLENLYMCADGVCVESPEYCKPIYDCPIEYFKCDDGTCRISQFCPRVIDPCPESRPFKCNDGRCVDLALKCYSTNESCNILNKIKCANGLCVDNVSKCVTNDSDSNSCSLKVKCEQGLCDKRGFRCLDGRCLEKREDCYSVNIACDADNPVLSPDGTCKKSYDDFSGVAKVGCNNENFIACPNKLCVKKDDYFVSCKNNIGCPLVNPIRCFDGSCVNDPNNCNSVFKCPVLKPFQCADFRCVEDLKYCNSYNDCGNGQTRCKNGLCLANPDCSAVEKLCPILAPVKCENGMCVDNISECHKSFLIEECKEGEIFCYTRGSCAKSNEECIGEDYVAGKKNSNTRLLQNSNLLTSDAIENNCNIENPYSCFDGTCRKRREDCPLKNACLSNEFKCFDGSCAKDYSKCKNKHSTECASGLQLCNDGLCRKICPSYNGCDAKLPYQCSNGRCVKNKLECLGYSVCEENQYRCINGECKKDPNECDDIKRLYSPQKQIITISRFDNFQRDLVFDKNRRSIANLFVPANSFNITNKDAKYGNIEINHVPHSALNVLSYVYNQTDTFQFSISNSIKDSDGELNFENSVLSPVINITCTGCENKFINPGLLTIEHNYYVGKDLSYQNYCLAKLVNNKWRCFDTIASQDNITRQNLHLSNCNKGDIVETSLCGSRKNSENQITFAIDSFGVYAVVIIPINKKIELIMKDNVIYTNLKLVIISSTVTATVIFIMYLIFIRILRYRQKYIQNKKRIENIQSGVSYMMNLNLSFPGATIGDALNGINFDKNPCYKFKEIAKDPIREKEEEIDRMATKCNNMEKNNNELMKEIDKIRDEYNELRRIVEKMKKT